MGEEQKTCFMVSPIGSDGSKERERSNKLQSQIIEPAVEPEGYDVVRSDDIAEPGRITDQIIEYVYDSELVVADLTGGNPNVFYELAIRHATKKPYIQVRQEGFEIPFDLAATRTITYNLSNPPSSSQELMEFLQQLEDGTGQPDSPVTQTIKLLNTRDNGDRDDYQIADIMERLQHMQAMINRLNDPRNPTIESKDSHDKLRNIKRNALSGRSNMDELIEELDEHHDIGDDAKAAELLEDSRGLFYGIDVKSTELLFGV
jgi:hypothetical protein